jgi:hypothetical protein
MLLLAGVVSAGHNPAVVEIETVECGETTFSATVNDPAGTHLVSNMRLVVHADGVTQFTDVIPVDGSAASLTVGPFAEDTTILWRVFGGGERDYDSPLWNGYGEPGFADEINAYADSLTEEEGDLDFSWVLSGPDDPNPFTTWHALPVEGCPPPPEDPVTKDECKNGGWMEFGFRNQGQCIRYVNTGQDSR